MGLHKTEPFVVHQQFHAVGHGTFFTGIAYPLSNPAERMCWVYDCGSKRPTRVREAIDRLDVNQFLPKDIDLLVLSHFDDDHINGVEHLLRNHDVKFLVIPYMSLESRLFEIANPETSCSASTALFQLDPIGWLGSKNLTEKVKSIIFVKGGIKSERGDLEAGIAPRVFDPESLNVLESDSGYVGDYWFKNGLSGINLRVWEDRIPGRLPQLPIEFMFFNSYQTDLFVTLADGSKVAKRSKTPIFQIQSEIRDAIEKSGLLHKLRKPKSQWRDELRKLYEKHFGSTGPSRNNISLCLLINPQPKSHQFWCTGVFETDVPSLCLGCFERSCRTGVLCQGDLRVDGALIGEMETHFSKARWDNLGVVQVPHHGSKHSWFKGNAQRYNPNFFVNCIPDSSTVHPHKEVEQDLKGYVTLCANYQHGVAMCYWVQPN